MTELKLMECSRECELCERDRNLTRSCGGFCCSGYPKIVHVGNKEVETKKTDRWTVGQLIDALIKLPSEAEVLITPELDEYEDQLSQFVNGVRATVWRDGTAIVYIEGEV